MSAHPTVRPTVWLLLEDDRVVQNYLSFGAARSAGQQRARDRYRVFSSIYKRVTFQWMEVEIGGARQLLAVFEDRRGDTAARTHRQPVPIYVREYFP